VILFHDPGRPGAGGDAAKNETTIIFATVGAEDQDATGFESRTGRRGWRLRGPEHESATTAQPPATRAAPIAISSEEFIVLWKLLAETSLFAIPRYPGGEPPEGEPYFQLDEGLGQDARRHIILRPDRSPRPAASKAELEAWFRSWQNAKRVLVQFMVRG
jgi:hypothetical protein